MSGLERAVGDVVGGYRVDDRLGRGGSSAVYLVTDGGGHQAALKLVDTADVGARERLAREVDALASVRHPAVPRVIDWELDAEDAFVVFDYVPGHTLQSWVREHGPLDATELAALAGRLADALGAVHAAGAIHRDVTPPNVVLGPDGPVLIDFGLSQRDHDPRLTRVGLVSGTAGYVAPEVIDGAEPSPQADWWGWAATVAFAATGRAPFGVGPPAVRRTLEGDLDIDDFVGAHAVAAALDVAPSARPRAAAVISALTAGTTTFALEALPRTLIADVAYEEDGEPDVDDDRAEDDAKDGHRAGPMRRRRTVLVAWAIAIAAWAALAPVIAASALVFAAWVARAVDISARGPRHPAARVLLAPVAAIRAVIETIPSVLTGLLFAGAIGGGLWWVVPLLERSESTTRLLQSVALVFGAAALVGGIARGPASSATRRGAHRVAGALTRARVAAVVSILFALAAIVGALALVRDGIDPTWWPAPPVTIGA